MRERGTGLYVDASTFHGTRPVQPLRIRMEPADYQRVKRTADSASLSVSEFVRRAVANELERSAARDELQGVAELVSQLLDQMRAEHHIHRQELADEAKRAIAETTSRAEKLVKTLVLQVAQSVDGSKPAARKPTDPLDPDRPPL